MSFLDNTCAQVYVHLPVCASGSTPSTLNRRMRGGVTVDTAVPVRGTLWEAQTTTCIAHRVTLHVGLLGTSGQER